MKLQGIELRKTYGKHVILLFDDQDQYKDCRRRKRNASLAFRARASPAALA